MAYGPGGQPTNDDLAFPTSFPRFPISQRCIVAPDVMEATMGRFVTTQALARRYGVLIGTILTWRRRGWITALRRPGKRAFLFDPEAADRALAERGYVTAATSRTSTSAVLP
jgi:hypothetical protein